MPVTRLGHVNIQTPLFAETIAFYEAALGLRRGRAASMHDQDQYAWLYDDRGVAVVHVNAPRAGQPEPATGVVSRLDHVAFDCTDPEGFAARLDAAAIPYSSSDSEAGRLRQFALRDPNDLKVELTFQLDAAP